jgi:hypothetical protein
MPTQDNTITTRTQRLNAQKTVIGSNKKQTSFPASYRTQLVLAKVPFVQKSYTLQNDGKTVTPGCGVKDSSNTCS